MNAGAGQTLYAPYLTNPAAAAAAAAAALTRVRTPALTTAPTDMQQVLASLAAANAATSATIKDSRWLTLEVCRQYQRKMCSRDENECKFAHPPPHVDVQNGRVICCYDSIKGKCQRRDPPCKYFHPPQHLRELLLQNGRNNLIMKNMHLQFLQQQLAQGALLTPGAAPGTAVGLSGVLAAAAAAAAAASNQSAASAAAVNPGGPSQCTNPNSPVSSASLGPTGKLIYQPAPSMSLPPHGMATSYSLLASSQATTPAAAAGLEASFPTSVLDPTNHHHQTQQQPSLSAGYFMSPAARKRPAPCVSEDPWTLYGLQAPPPTQILAYPQQLDPGLLFPGQSLAGIGLSPYLGPTQQQLNSMAAAAAAVAAASALKPVAPPPPPPPPTVSPAANPTTAAQLAAMAAAIGPLSGPAKRPALADTKSGLPAAAAAAAAAAAMFDYSQGLYAPPQMPQTPTLSSKVALKTQQQQNDGGSGSGSAAGGGEGGGTEDKQNGGTETEKGRSGGTGSSAGTAFFPKETYTEQWYCGYHAERCQGHHLIGRSVSENPKVEM